MGVTTGTFRNENASQVNETMGGLHRWKKKMGKKGKKKEALDLELGEKGRISGQGISAR